MFNKKYSNGGDCMCEGETTQRRSTAHDGAVVPLCAVAWFLQTGCFCYRQDAAKRQIASIKFTHRPKIGFFAPQGRLVAPIHVKISRGDEQMGPLGCAKFHLNRRRGGNAAPKYQKFPLFGKESPRRGDSLDRFRKFWGLLYIQSSRISGSNLTSFAS